MPPPPLSNRVKIHCQIYQSVNRLQSFQASCYLGHPGHSGHTDHSDHSVQTDYPIIIIYQLEILHHDTR